MIRILQLCPNKHEGDVTSHANVIYRCHTDIKYFVHLA